jgi:plastocyanin
MTVVNHDPRFQPDHVSAKAGTVAFSLDNIPGSATEAPDHMMLIGDCISFYGDGSIRAGQAVAATPHIAANQRATFTVNGLEPGTYVFWCAVNVPDGGNHASNGMVGTLTITP